MSEPTDQITVSRADLERAERAIGERIRLAEHLIPRNSEATGLRLRRTIANDKAALERITEALK